MSGRRSAKLVCHRTRCIATNIWPRNLLPNGEVEQRAAAGSQNEGTYPNCATPTTPEAAARASAPTEG